MKYLFVLVVSLLVGVAVYVLSLRTEDEAIPGLGFSPEAPGGRRRRHETDAPTPAYEDAAQEPVAGTTTTYLRILTDRTSWRDRLQGFIGLVVLVMIASTVLALSVYEVGHLINSTIAKFLQK